MKRATRTREGYHWFRGWRKPSAAQRRVLDELLVGGSNAEIAARLDMSEDGVKWHLSELRQELEIDDRRQLAEWWRTERQHSNVFLPLGALGNLFGNHALAVVAGVAVAAAGLGWLAYTSLEGTGDGSLAGQASQTAVPAPAVVIPTPTATPVPATALVFDTRLRSATTLPGNVMFRRWLDPEALTFVGDANGPTVIDAEGKLTPLSGSTGGAEYVAYYPVPGTSAVVLWRGQAGRLSTIDTRSLQERVLADIGLAPGRGRVAAVSIAARKLAFVDDSASELRVLSFEGGSSSRLYAAPPERVLIAVNWSGDGRSLVLLSGRSTTSQASVVDTITVLDGAGKVIVERPGTGYWVGGAWWRLSELNSAGVMIATTRLLNAQDGSEAPVADTQSLACVSPDGRYGVYQFAASPRFEQRSELRVLATNEVIVEARNEGFLSNCDWTPDSRKVVLSPGGK
jgi:DNA-binding CsgD family transcriptional regulator